MNDVTNCRSSSDVVLFSDILRSSLANIGFSMNVIISQKILCMVRLEKLTAYLTIRMHLFTIYVNYAYTISNNPLNFQRNLRFSPKLSQLSPLIHYFEGMVQRVEKSLNNSK